MTKGKKANQPRANHLQSGAPAQKRAPRKKNGGGNQMSSIDAGYSDSTRQTFTWGNKPVKQMEMILAAYEVGAGNATPDGLRPSTGVAQQCSYVTLGLTYQRGGTAAGASVVAPFLSPALDLEASSFTRFRVKKLRFKYCPQSGTNTTQRMVFAYANDPTHPLINTTTPSQAQLESVSDSVPFAPWKPWEVDMSRNLDKTSWLYTYDTAQTGGATNDTLERFQSLGVIGLMASANGTAVSGDVFGVLYMIADLEFKEFCPISITRPALLRHLAAKMIEHAERREASARGITHSGRTDPDTDDDSISSSSSKPEPKPLHSREFIEQFKNLRKQGIPADECIAYIRAGNPLLSDEVDRLIETTFGKTAHASSSSVPDIVSTSSGYLSETSSGVSAEGKGKGKEK